MHLTSIQPGKPRNSNEIEANLEKVLRLACSGVKSNVAKEQAATGIKDQYTQFWIDQLLSRAQELKNQHMSPTQIQDELLRWVDEKMATIKNEIFTLKGTSTDSMLMGFVEILSRV
jgi:GMP synthase PP-ATPase subunit